MNYREILRKKYYGVRRRCNDTGRKDSHVYQAKGIKCEWKESADFINDMLDSFIQHVEKHGRQNTTLDRIDPDGNYSKENCRWATWQVQRRNNSLMKWYEFRGEKLTFHELADKVKINWMTLWHRMHKGGKTLEEAVAMPFKPRTKGNKWAEKFDGCLNCGEKEKKHHGKGLCLKCYQKICVRKVLPMPK